METKHSGPPTGARRANAAALFFVSVAASATLLTGCSEKPVVTVNGKSLSEKEFGSLCAAYTPQPNQQSRSSVGQMVVAGWIRRSMMEQEAKAKGVYPTEKEVNDRIDGLRRQLSYLGQDFDEQLRQQGRTLEAYKSDLIDQMLTERLVFAEATVTDEEVKKYWEQQKEALVQPESVEISMLTVDNEKDLKAAQDDLNAPAPQFPLIAQSRSKDAFKDQGGRVPRPLPKELPPGVPVPQEVVDQAFKMEPGQISDPIKVGATWVFVKLEDKKERKEPKFEDFAGDLKIQMQMQKVSEAGQPPAFQRRWAELTKEAKIEIFRPEYQGIKEQIQAGVAEGGPPTGPGGDGPPPPPPGG